MGTATIRAKLFVDWFYLKKIKLLQLIFLKSESHVLNGLMVWWTYARDLKNWDGSLSCDP